MAGLLITSPMMLKMIFEQPWNIVAFASLNFVESHQWIWIGVNWRMRIEPEHSDDRPGDYAACLGVIPVKYQILEYDFFRLVSCQLNASQGTPRELKSEPVDQILILLW
jgi:hypothetical protein